MRIIGMVSLIALSLIIVACAAVAQQASSPAGTAQGTAQTFSLGNDRSYRIAPLSNVDTWRANEMGISWVTFAAGKPSYVTYETGPVQPIAAGSGANTVVFGPGGYRGAISWNGTGNMSSHQFTGNVGQNLMITQLSGGTKDRVIASFD
jgi:hypothetical protein